MKTLSKWVFAIILRFRLWRCERRREKTLRLFDQLQEEYLFLVKVCPSDEESISALVSHLFQEIREGAYPDPAEISVYLEILRTWRQRSGADYAEDLEVQPQGKGGAA